MCNLLIGVVVLALTAGTAWAEGEPVAVYVFAPATRGGFVDRDLRESQAEVAKVCDKLRRYAHLAVVDAAEGSDIQVEITSANVSKWSGRTVAAVLIRGGYRLDPTGKQGMMSSPRGQIAKQVAEWVKQNAARLQ
jgi:hypothetical protein